MHGPPSAEPAVIETPRLVLRQWRDSDLEPFARLNANPDVMAYFPATLSRDDSDAGARRARTFIAEHGWGLWAIEVPGVAPFVGFTGLNIPVFDAPFMPCVEIGWRLDKPFWGRGYATEAALAALWTGFEKLQLPEIVSFTPVEHRRSRAVMEHIGMRHDGEQFDHPQVPEDSGLRRHVLYRLSRIDFNNRGGRST